MAHRAERDRKNAARALFQEQRNAEHYSYTANGTWETALARAFGVHPWEVEWRHSDLTREYDAYVRLLARVATRWEDDERPKTRAERVARALERKAEDEKRARQRAAWNARNRDPKDDDERESLLEELRAGVRKVDPT